MARDVSASLRRKFSPRQTFAALKYPNYRLWFCGQMTSLFGTWMQSTAQGYLVFQLTHSPAYLGYVSFAAGIPGWLLALFGGVVADRAPRRTLLVITQSFMMLLAFILATLTFTHVVRPWHILILAFSLGIANAFDAPARQSFVLEMVEREDLTNAIALNSTMFNTATVIGPTTAGLTYAAFGPAWCFVLNGFSFLAVIVALLLMHIEPLTLPTRRTSPLADLKEGLRYVLGHPMVRALIILVAAINLFGSSYTTLFPAWAVEVLGGDARTNGLLISARGLGALLAALLIASLGRFRFKGRLLTIGTFIMPLSMLLFATARSLPLSLLILSMTGAATILALNLANSLVQTLSADEFRGRVMGLYSLTFLGFFPIGGLLVGTVAQRIGEPPTVILCALASVVIALLVWLYAPRLRALP